MNPACAIAAATENATHGFRFCVCGFSITQSKTAFSYPRGLDDAIKEHLSPAGNRSAAGTRAVRITAPAVRAAQGVG